MAAAPGGALDGGRPGASRSHMMWYGSSQLNTVAVCLSATVSRQAHLTVQIGRIGADDSTTHQGIIDVVSRAWTRGSVRFPCCTARPSIRFFSAAAFLSSVSFTPARQLRVFQVTVGVILTVNSDRVARHEQDSKINSQPTRGRVANTSIHG